MISVGAKGIESINSEYIRKDLKRIKSSETEKVNFSSEDKVELSSQATDLKKMQAAAMAQPDVRTDKVEQIRMKVENGTYQSYHEDVAERLIQEAVDK